MHDDEAEVRALFASLMTAWTDNDATAYGACFTDDCDYVSYDGTWARDRSTMQEAHDRLFRGVLAGSALVGDVQSVRFPTSGVAIVHATGSVLMPWRTRLPARRLSRQTLVAVRTRAGWRFTALHNSRVRPRSIPAPDAFPSRASHVLARVGSRPIAPPRAAVGHTVR